MIKFSQAINCFTQFINHTQRNVHFLESQTRDRIKTRRNHTLLSENVVDTMSLSFILENSIKPVKQRFERDWWWWNGGGGGGGEREQRAREREREEEEDRERIRHFVSEY